MYLSEHQFEGLWPAIMLSMFDVQRVWYYGILCANGAGWALIHLALCDFDFSEAITGIYALFFCLLLLAVSSHGRMGTLKDCFNMNVLRKEAEDGYKRFLSYMMHEMRNPIGGAMFLLDDLEHTSRLGLSQRAKQKETRRSPFGLDSRASLLPLQKKKREERYDPNSDSPVIA
eukprot:Cvel_864.t2-p1 / transcript=Cvel_864.t2 / gene=Cvel_864 / organism=Chromera_velia_CCMP2878 / gene_product=hypothetical protein / transcript_product=hypothetical protein / location=Cvel_scaffold27:51596-52687(-) / protein_length=172 / sequence_SO=supercontig / SO=protein_coding / is_pseudo=false